MHECKDLLANQLLLYALASFSIIKRRTETIIVWSICLKSARVFLPEGDRRNTGIHF